MKTISIKVNDKLAARYKQLSENEKQGISYLLNEIMDDPRSLSEVMEDMAKYAKNKGLTQEELNEILNEDDE